MTQIPVGTIEHYYPSKHAAVVKLDRGTLRVGDQVHIIGRRDDLWEEVTSLQSENKPVQSAGVGLEVGMHVDEPVHRGSEVYKVTALEAYTPHAAMNAAE